MEDIEVKQHPTSKEIIIRGTGMHDTVRIEIVKHGAWIRVDDDNGFSTSAGMREDTAKQLFRLLSEEV